MSRRTEALISSVSLDPLYRLKASLCNDWLPPSVSFGLAEA